MRIAIVAAALVLCFIAGAGIARAYYGWRQVSTPCAPTGVAMNGTTIAIICDGDQHVYIQDR